MTETTSIKVPFPGLYGSILADELDHEESQAAEYEEERQEEEGIDPKLRLDASIFTEIFYKVTDYRAAHEATARAYCDAFEIVASDALGFPLGLEFEEMTSPREYNFETDRLFARIPDASLTRLFEMSVADGHKTFGALIKERHSSRSGFISFYSNSLEEWLERGLGDWDYNELETLLLACLAIAGEPDIEDRVSMAVIEGGGLYEEFSNAVDWDEFAAEVTEARQERTGEALDENPDRLNRFYRALGHSQAVRWSLSSHALPASGGIREP